MGLWWYVAKRMVLISMVPYLGRHKHHKELNLIMLTAILWEQHWVDKTVLFRCDKHAIVHCIQTCSSKEPLVAQLPCGLFMLAACPDFAPSGVAHCKAGQWPSRLAVT